MTSRFNLPIDLPRLQNDRLRLVPLEDNLEEWAEIYIQDGVRNPHVWDWLTYGPFTTTAEYVSWYHQEVGSSNDTLLLAIVLKAGTVDRKDPVTGEIKTTHVTDGTFAGICGMIGHPKRATVELGQLLLTEFQRTFVGTQSNALLLHHCLDSVVEGELGMRRVQWLANARNVASVNAAKRMGFQFEGIIRWEQVLPLNKRGSDGAGLDEGVIPRVGVDGRELGSGRHSAMLSLCWDDWVNGGMEHINKLVRR
ncbi:putative GNAT family acetyltransferase [Coniochaeta sp. 2T2.1]|nr:putative GNAT family acetyltransferase [Coniochaeta sp. 2T2.1]